MHLSHWQGAGRATGIRGWPGGLLPANSHEVAFLRSQHVLELSVCPAPSGPLGNATGRPCRPVGPQKPGHSGIIVWGLGTTEFTAGEGGGKGTLVKPQSQQPRPCRWGPETQESNGPPGSAGGAALSPQPETSRHAPAPARAPRTCEGHCSPRDRTERPPHRWPQCASTPPPANQGLQNRGQMCPFKKSLCGL